jgi:hypothetical protein
MVHALRRVAGLVTPAGQVIDIRSLDEKAEFLVCADRAVSTSVEQAVNPACPRHDVHAGWLNETDEGIEYRQAEAALQTALAEGVFVLLAQHRFAFRHHAPDLPAMRAYLAETWTDAIIEADVERAVTEAFQKAGGRAEVVLCETGWMRVLSTRR